MKEFFRCKDCKHDKGKCVGVSRRASHKNCFEKKTMTNADRIRAMSDEELAIELGIKQCPDKERWKDCSGDCEACWLEWLMEPAEENGDNNAAD